MRVCRKKVHVKLHAKLYNGLRPSRIIRFFFFIELSKLGSRLPAIWNTEMCVIMVSANTERQLQLSQV